VTDVIDAEARARAPTRPPRRRGLLAAGALLVVAVVGVAIWFLARDDDPSEPPAFNSACGTVVHPEGRVRERVLLVGDSLMAQPSCELAAALGSVGVQTHMQAVPGSGLLAGPGWGARFDRLLDSVHPDVVVALFVGNYIGAPATDFSGRAIAADSDLFFAFWQQRAAELSRRARDAGARLYWVEPPPLDDGGRAARLFEGYTRLGDPTLSSGRALAGPGGVRVESIPSCEEGAPLRTPDGVHLTPAGAHVFARALGHDLADALGLPAIARAC
jgi:lysophospholipase L1-like esterase